MKKIEKKSTATTNEPKNTMKPNDWGWSVCYEFVQIFCLSVRLFVFVCMNDYVACESWNLIHIGSIFGSKRWRIYINILEDDLWCLAQHRFTQTRHKSFSNAFLRQWTQNTIKNFVFFFSFWKCLGASTCFLHVYSLLWFPFIQIRFLLCSILY